MLSISGPNSENAPRRFNSFKRTQATNEQLPAMEPTLLSPHNHHILLSNSTHNPYSHHTRVRLPRRQVIKAFQRSDFDSFAKRVSSGEAWKDVWSTANDKFEYFTYEARRTAERIDREYKVSVKVNSAVRALQDKVREIEREFEIGQKWRGFAVEFSRNWPRVCDSVPLVEVLNF